MLAITSRRLKTKDPAELHTLLWDLLRDYDLNLKYRRAEYVTKTLRALSAVASRLASALDGDGFPPLDSLSAQERRLARDAHSLGWALIVRAKSIENGQGDLALESSRSGDVLTARHGYARRSPVTIKRYVEAVIDGCKDLEAQLYRQVDAEDLRQILVDLTASYDACKRCFNALKGRPPTSEERQHEFARRAKRLRAEVADFFDRLFGTAVPFPPQDALQRKAKAVFTDVLYPKGDGIHLMPREGALEVLELVAKRYFHGPYSGDFLKRAVGGRRDRVVRPSAAVRALIATERQRIFSAYGKRVTLISATSARTGAKHSR